LCGLARGFAACFAAIVIPVSSFQLSDFTLQGNKRITDSCVIRNDPRKENKKFYPLLYSVAIRFSFSGITTNYETLNQIALLLLYVVNLIKHKRMILNNKEN